MARLHVREGASTSRPAPSVSPSASTSLGGPGRVSIPQGRTRTCSFRCPIATWRGSRRARCACRNRTTT
jgi:hypothetical protein